MAAILWNVLPILIGAACGYIFSLPVNIGLSVIAAGVGGMLLWQTRNAELGSLIGVIAAALAFYFLAGMWVTIAIVSGFVLHLDLYWLLRSPHQ